MNDAMDKTMDLIASLKIKKVELRSVGGGWVSGTIGGHQFDALVFSEHADEPSYELGDSRISKISIQRISDRVTVACFDRGWDLQPTTPEARDIIDVLAGGLVESIIDAIRTPGPTE